MQTARALFLPSPLLSFHPPPHPPVISLPTAPVLSPTSNLLLPSPTSTPSPLITNSPKSSTTNPAAARETERRERQRRQTDQEGRPGTRQPQHTAVSLLPPQPTLSSCCDMTCSHTRASSVSINAPWQRRATSMAEVPGSVSRRPGGKLTVSWDRKGARRRLVVGRDTC
eukprot:763027-Hanusia_phi.AAC.1